MKKAKPKKTRQKAKPIRRARQNAKLSARKKSLKKPKKPVKKTTKKAVKKRKVVRKKPLRKAKKVKSQPETGRSWAKKSVKKRKVAKRKPKKRKIIKKRKPVSAKFRKARLSAKRKAVKRKVVKKRVVRKKPARKKTIRKPAKIRRRKKTKGIKRTYLVGSPLEQLFESQTKVRTMKLFFRNPEANFLLKEAAKMMKMNLPLAKKQIKRLEKIGLLKSRQISSRKQLFSINPNFDFFKELRELILNSSPVSKDKMLKTIKSLGKIKLALLSGLFIGNDPLTRPSTEQADLWQDMAQADLLIVGDKINQRKLTGFIENLEAEAGTEINCVIMTTEEFKYRYDMYDRFVRDLLNEKSELLINKLGL